MLMSFLRPTGAWRRWRNARNEELCNFRPVSLCSKIVCAHMYRIFIEFFFLAIVCHRCAAVALRRFSMFRENKRHILHRLTQITVWYGLVLNNACERQMKCVCVCVCDWVSESGMYVTCIQFLRYKLPNYSPFTRNDCAPDAIVFQTNRTLNDFWPPMLLP